MRRLQRLNYLTGELLINQNRQALQEEKIKAATKELLVWLQTASAHSQ